MARVRSAARILFSYFLCVGLCIKYKMLSVHSQTAHFFKTFVEVMEHVQPVRILYLPP